MNHRIEDLGVAGVGETSLDGGPNIVARHPVTNEEYAIHPTMEHGFIAIQPARRFSIHIRPDLEKYERTSRGAAQGPDGCIYNLGFHKGQCYASEQTWSVLRWNWSDPISVPVAEFSGFTNIGAQLEFDLDGRLYFNALQGLCRLTMATRKVEVVADKASPPLCSRRDGWLYFICGPAVLGLDPRTGGQKAVMTEAGAPCPRGAMQKDGRGHIILPVVVEKKDGRAYWLELRGGKAVAVDAATVQLAETMINPLDVAQSEPWMTQLASYAFADGGYISRIVRREATYIDANGRMTTFPLEFKDRPLQLYSMEIGGGRIWLGTVLPLYLLSYDLKAGTFVNHGHPSPVIGEVYNMVWSDNRLFMASYVQAYVTRFDPARPWRLDRSAQANPFQFGRMKEEGPSLHRIHGRAIDPAGNVYFAAFGDYGCEDSGVCQIDIHTEKMKRWIYPKTTMTSLTYLPQTGQLMVCERKQGDSWLRASFLAPDTGEVIASEPLIEDQGDVVAWLHDGGDWIYGLHDYRATIFAYSLKERRIVGAIRELGFGHHCKGSLIFGPDQRIWGLTAGCVFAVDRKLTAKEKLAEYADQMLIPHSRFNLVFGPDGHLYFMNGAHLMRMRWDAP